MEAVANKILEEEIPRARLALLLKHFFRVDDGRELSAS
jgi:hypothetical protein